MASTAELNMAHLRALWPQAAVALGGSGDTAPKALYAAPDARYAFTLQTLEGQHVSLEGVPYAGKVRCNLFFGRGVCPGSFFGGQIRGQCCCHWLGTQSNGSGLVIKDGNTSMLLPLID